VTRVLIADDNSVIRHGVTALLEASADDIQVVGEAGTGREAIERAAELRPDVVLLDIRMPVMDGVEAARRLSAEFKVMMLSYSSEEHLVTAAIKAGARGYLVHGRFEPDELVRAVREVAAGGTVVSPAVAPIVFDAVRHGPSESAEPDPYDLTAREREVMQLVARGHSNREIADELVVSEKTVKNHVHNAYMKLGVKRRAEAIAKWLGVTGAALCLALFGLGCNSDDDGEDQPAASKPRESRPAKPPLAADWYEDPDEDFMPTAIEERMGTDPLVNECLEELRCPGVDPETASPDPPPAPNTLLMLDSSGSMAGPAGGGETKIEAARDSLRRFTAGTPESFPLGFLVFGHRGSNQPSGKRESCRGVEVLVPLGRLDRARFSNRTLDRFQPTGFTPIAGALDRAARAFRGHEGEDNRVILVTDGIETCGRDPVKRARRLKRSGVRVTVDVVGFDIASARDRERLKRIAGATGGTYTDAQTGDQLRDYFDRQRRRVSQLLDASICISTTGTDVRICASTTVTDASIEMSRLVTDAHQASQERRAEALQRLRERMKEDFDEWQASHRERTEGLADELRDERRALEERLRRLND
jgi:DNA-binding NarL/FixJ family response regulator